MAPTADTNNEKLINRATHELKQLFHDHKNYNIQMFLNGLSPTASSDYSQWEGGGGTKKTLKNPSNFYTTSDTTRNMSKKQC
jgi:hypothetical protein